jgi:GNAT superfamily N-acetyltransferase
MLVFMSTEPTIRQCEVKDAPIIVDLGRRTFLDTFAAVNESEHIQSYVSEAFSPDQITSELVDPDSIFLLAETGGIPVGYAKIRAGVPPDCVTGTNPVEVERIYSDHAFLGKGVGAGLMRTCLNLATTLGHDAVWLGVWDQNPRAIAFYKKWGFEIVGEKTFMLGTDIQRDTVYQVTI